MAYTIAVTGKGGTGKTTISSLIVAQLIKNGKTPILAIDADPNSNFNERLGVEPGITLGDLEVEVLKRKANISAGMDKHRYVEYQLQTALMEETGFDLLVTGRTEGPGCYCSVNNILRETLQQLELLADPSPHFVLGLSNVSQGTKKRSLINRTYLTICIAMGLDSAIVNPFDTELMDAMITAELLLNKHIYSDSFIAAYHSNRRIQ